MPVLKIKSKGNEVKKLQRMLKQLGYAVEPDGDFGSGTEKAVKKFQREHNLDDDGVVGKNTMDLLVSLIANTPVVPATNTSSKTEAEWLKTKTWDKATDQRIALVHPKIRAKAIEFIVRCQNELGKTFRVSSSLRTIKEQNELYAQGRTQAQLNAKGLNGVTAKPEKLQVTKVIGGYSYHNYGLAIDVVEIKSGKAIWNQTDWKPIVAIAKQLGFKWGGDWKSFKDLPHFQITFGKTASQLLEIYMQGDRVGEYVNV